ncbi:MAG: phytoene desaturase family protein [Actinomycetota bacterium]
MAKNDVIVIGAGHNGLIAAAYLAKAGKEVTVLERADEVGGILRPVPLAEGFTAPGLVHTVGRLRQSVIDDLKLTKHGYEPIVPAVRVFAPQPDGEPVTFWADANKTADGLRSRSVHDASAYPEFDRKIRSIASFLAYVNVATPPDVASPSIADAIAGLKLGKAFKNLGAKAGRETVRTLATAVADLVGDTFEEEAVRGPLATRGVLYTSLGPWAAGTSANLLNDSAGNDGGAPGQSTYVKGGTGALASALANAARSFGVEIRTGVEVAAIRTRGGRVLGVTLADGSDLDATIVVSAIDPKQTLRMCDPVELGPTMTWRGEKIRQRGATAKVDLALGGLPAFAGADEERLRGRIVIGPTIDDVERAMDAYKYGHVAESPMLEATIPTLADPSLAPEGKHVMSVLVQAAPRHLREGDWAGERESLGDIVLKRLEQYAPGLSGLVEARTITTPQDFETAYGLTGGELQHAAPGLDQWFAWRPLNREARYAFVLEGLYLGGSGAHPGGGITGGPGANCARQLLKDLSKK